MAASERRQAIIDVLRVRRHDTMDNLAFEFETSRRTIVNDIAVLSLTYPIFTSKGVGGGVYVMDGAMISVESRFNAEQTELLKRLFINLKGKDAEVMKTILLKYGKP